MPKIQTNATFPQAFHSQTLPFMATRIGTFRMDLGMIFEQPGTEHSPPASLRLLCIDRGSRPAGHRAQYTNL